MKQQITSHYNLFSHLSKKLQGPLWWIIETATKQCPDKIGKINVLLVFTEIYAKMGHTWHHQEGSTNTGNSCGKWTVTNSSEVWQLDRLEVNDLSPACQRHSAVLQRNTWLLCVWVNDNEHEKHIYRPWHSYCNKDYFSRLPLNTRNL